jgi:hypothetical protein
VVMVSATERAVTLLRISRILGVRWSDLKLLKDVGKVAVAAALAGSVAALARALIGPLKPFWVLAAGGTVFVLVYAAAVFALRIVTAEEKVIIRAKFEVMWRHLAPEAAR